MRLIPITEYDDQTMQLAKPVFDNQRRVLLSANQIIHPKYLERLKQIGIRSLVVEDAESKGITLEEMMDVPSWVDIVYGVKEAYEAVKAKKPLPLRSLLEMTGRLIKEIQSRPLVLPVPAATLGADLLPYAHAVNVTIMSLQVGKALSYNELMLRDLAVGCLLHDIGKTVTEDEKKHPEAGFEIIRSHREISLLSAHVAFQHHETMNGQGYPRALQGSAFHEYAQICGLCNAYDHLIETVPPHDAMERVMAAGSIRYSPHIAQAFVKTIPAYPPGTKVRIRNGEDAIVTKITSHMQRPVVRFLSSGTEIALAEHPTVMIAGY